MKHKVRVQVETEKKGLFGTRKVKEFKTIEVDDKTWRKMKKEKQDAFWKGDFTGPVTTEELLYYDEVLGEDW